MQQEQVLFLIRNQLARTLPLAISRKVFSPAKLSELLKVSIHPEHDCVTVDLGQQASFAFCLELQNQGPFAIKVNSAKVVFWCCGRQLESAMHVPLRLESGEATTFWVRKPLSALQAKTIGANLGQHQFGIAISLRCTSEREDFFKATGYLGGVGLRFTNVRDPINQPISHAAT